MKILFDQGTPVPLRKFIADHEVKTAFEMGWSSFTNGDLLKTAEAAGFEAMVTTDKNLRYQQSLTNRKIAILVLATTSWPLLKMHLQPLIGEIAALLPGGYVEIIFPSRPPNSATTVS